jgi:hypothetical protein
MGRLPEVMKDGIQNVRAMICIFSEYTFSSLANMG